MDWTSSSGLLDAAALQSLLAFLEGAEGEGSTSSGYVYTRQVLVDFFRWRQVTSPEIFADRTLDQVAKKLVEGRESLPDRPQVLLDTARYVLERGLELGIQDSEPSLDRVATDKRTTVATDRFTALRECLEELKPEERDGLLGYHFPLAAGRDRKRAELAKHYRLSLGELSRRMGWLRDQVETCIRSKVAQRKDHHG